MEYRKHELEKYKSIWLTKEAYAVLRKEKKRSIKDKNGKSMMRIINDMILSYENNSDTTTKRIQ